MKVYNYFDYLQPKISPPRAYDPRNDPRMIQATRMESRTPMIDNRYSPESGNPAFYQHQQNYQTNINDKKELINNNVNINAMINT